MSSVPNCPLCESIAIYTDSTKELIRCTGTNRSDCSLMGVAIPISAWVGLSMVGGEEDPPSKVYIVKRGGSIQGIFARKSFAEGFIKSKNDTKSEYYCRSYRVEGSAKDDQEEEEEVEKAVSQGARRFNPLDDPEVLDRIAQEACDELEDRMKKEEALERVEELEKEIERLQDLVNRLEEEMKYVQRT
jgi:hypothetical protein